MNGILLVLKPPGMTSFDVVSWLRGCFGVKRIGHAGTLDPAAVGLLPVCIGKAAKTIDWFQEFDKAYRAEMVLGITTNTQDGEGDILKETPVALDAGALEAALAAFRGEYEQLPPMFSAVKVNGKRLYELARQGEEIARKSRRVAITALNLLSAQLDRDHPVVRFDVTCSKGTYIRTLCADIGDKLGCGAYMSFLVRTRVGPFLIENAHTLEEIKSAGEEGKLAALLLPEDIVFNGLSEVSLEGKSLFRFINGAEISALDWMNDGQILRVYENTGSFIGLGKVFTAEDRKTIRAHKLFYIKPFARSVMDPLSAVEIRKGHFVIIFESGFTPPEGKNCGIGLGNFDGLHRGHMALINTLQNECMIHDLHSVVYTFKKHPEHILRKKLFTPLIMTMDHKARVLEKTGIGSLCFQEFDEEFSRMDPEAFIERVLVEKMRAKLVVVGFNYRFGYMGKGDTELMKKTGVRLGFNVIVIPPVKIREEVVSSTVIRQYILKGKMEKAFELLGRHFSVPGKVITGKRVGRTLGFPTANMQPERYLVMPAIGVYITRTLYQGRWYNSVTNVGRSPTVKQDTDITLETHMMGFQGELYGQDIEVFFLKKLRSEKKFESREELIDQIRLDIQKARQYWNT